MAPWTWRRALLCVALALCLSLMIRGVKDITEDGLWLGWTWPW